LPIPTLQIVLENGPRRVQGKKLRPEQENS
jgi:hypothetical protein